MAEAKPLGQLLRRPPRYGINAAAVPQGLGVPTYLRITDIDNSGRFVPEPRVGVAHPKSSDYRMGPGELVFARTGASVGKSYLYDPRDGELVYAGFLINIAPDPTLLNPKYLSLFAHSKDYWDWIARTSVRSGQPGVNGREYAQLPVPVPDIEVQNTIAAVMTDVDDLISGLERMIAKKQAIKQGMMQQLLTGRTRLPGFATEWRDARLGSLGMFLKGRGIKRDDVRSTGVACIRYGEIYTAFGDYTDEARSFVTPDVASTALPIRRGDVLFAGSGETKAEIGMSLAYTGKRDAVAGGDIIVLRGTGFDPVFLASLLNSPAVSAQKARKGQGDAVVHISSHALADVELKLPGSEEQGAIATVIKDADAEISALAGRLAKTRAIKQGMMQQLLTGRTRLPVEDTV
ncbi:restriction endonuclease subunit S [Nesterenkonia massiliensis]|uniref:restriction endonuclease subunit S n=1 Tax=Nesterenkonia massiliensis TaxID=1232429 RepID=UPI00131550B5|nr:restriction endonuclease subunit S [Nesterenkonia massiliensis]